MSMEDNVENIRRTILTLKKPSYQTTNRQNIRVRCPYCGDSHDLSNAHFYISMKPPFMFHCFKCETSGVLNSRVLRDLGIYDTDLDLEVAASTKEYKANTGTTKLSISKNKLKNTPIESEASYNSLNYLNGRFQTNFTIDYATQKFKAVLDLPHFFEENNVYMKPNKFDFSKAIGFISSDATHIICRDITGTQGMRYSNINLVPESEIGSQSKIYNISSNINIMNEKVQLILTEGIFDIIGIYNYYNLPESDNQIFAAACGKGYNAVITNYIRLGFLNLDIEIFSDGDVDLNFFKVLKNSSPYLKNSKITIYYNSLYNPQTKENKDFGVPKDRINLRKIIL